MKSSARLEIGLFFLSDACVVVTRRLDPRGTPGGGGDGRFKYDGRRPKVLCVHGYPSGFWRRGSATYFVEKRSKRWHFRTQETGSFAYTARLAARLVKEASMLVSGDNGDIEPKYLESRVLNSAFPPGLVRDFFRVHPVSLLSRRAHHKLMEPEMYHVMFLKCSKQQSSMQ